MAHDCVHLVLRCLDIVSYLACPHHAWFADVEGRSDDMSLLHKICVLHSGKHINEKPGYKCYI